MAPLQMRSIAAAGAMLVARIKDARLMAAFMRIGSIADFTREAAMTAKHGACVGALRLIKGTTVCEGRCTCFCRPSAIGELFTASALENATGLFFAGINLGMG